MKMLSRHRPRPSMEIVISASLSTPVKSRLVNWLPWSVLKISGRPYLGQRLVQCLDAEPGIHGVRQPPRQDMARRPVHDRDQIQEPAPHRDVGDVGAPDMIGAVHRHIPKQIGIDPVRRVRRAGPRRLVDRLQAHEPHQAPNPVTADRISSRRNWRTICRLP